MTSITIDGRTGTVVYVDDAWKLVDEKLATLAAVVFDDGGRTYYKLSPVAAPAGNLITRLKAMLRGAEFNPDQARDDTGKWTSGGGGTFKDPGGFEHTGITWKQDTDPVTGRPIPIVANSVEEAVAMIHEGKVVEVADVTTAHTVIGRLAEIANEAKAAGREAKDYDLCQVSVAGSNLFCAQSLRNEQYPTGVPRLEMPQLGGTPVPGSEADKLPKDKDGKVDGSAVFMHHLQSIGMRTEHDSVPAADLRASQRELIGSKVGGMMNAKGYDPGKVPIFVSSDNYVCTDTETEILTKRGWLSYDAVVAGDVALTLNHETGCSEWQPISEVHILPAESRQMLRMEGQSHSSLTTLDHRWPTLYLRDGGKGANRARRWRTSETLTVWDAIITSAECSTLPTIATIPDAVVELVAWTWTEGNIRPNGRNIFISQSLRANPQYCDAIRRALFEVFGPPVTSLKHAIKRVSHGYPRGWTYEDWPAWVESKVRNGEQVMFRLTKSASAVILAHLEAKIVTPAFLTSLTRSQLWLFIQRCIDADGSWQQQVVWVQKSAKSVAMFQMAASLVGCKTYPARDKASGVFYVSISKAGQDVVRPVRRSRRGLQTFKCERVTHDGMVWCPTTPNSSWLARRHGTVYYTGNCDGHHRWAAVVGRDAADGKLGDTKMNVIRVNAPISEVLHLANAWSTRFGIQQVAGVKR